MCVKRTGTWMPLVSSPLSYDSGLEMGRRKRWGRESQDTASELVPVGRGRVGNPGHL